MAKEYVVSNAFLAKDREGNVKTFNSQHGVLETWNLYFEGDDTKWQTNKKQGSTISKGDVLYGTTEIVERGGYKFPTFKSEQRPLGSLPTAPSRAVDGLDEKVDYMIKMLEDIQNRVGLNDIAPVDAGPIDLSDIPF